MIRREHLFARYACSPLFRIYLKILEATDGMTKPANVVLTPKEMDAFLASHSGVQTHGEIIEEAFGTLLDPKSKTPSRDFEEKTGLCIDVVSDARRIEIHRLGKYFGE